MARSRNIKPGFFVNEDLIELDPLARLLFIGLWTLADREGRLEDRPRKIKLSILPGDDCNIDHLLNELARYKFIIRYEVDGLKCIQIVNWHKHQNPHHMEVPSELPAPQGTENKYIHAPITKAQRQRILDRDGNKCVECGVTKSLSIDHIIPVSKGGDSSDENLRTLCKTCNSKKGNRTNDSITSREQNDNNSLTSREQVDKNAFYHTDSFYSDSFNLIPDSKHMSPNGSTENTDGAQSTTGKGQKTPAEKSDGYSPEFELFWQQYPNKKEKKAAFEKWKARIREGVDPHTLIKCAVNYKEFCLLNGIEPRFIKHPKTFLGPNKPYEDYLQTGLSTLSVEKSNISNKKQDILEKFRKAGLK